MHPGEAHALLRRGTVIPAHLLALNASRKLDRRRQRALTRYYLDAGAGGLAVGVHATQFAIREAGLYEEVLELAMAEAKGRVPMIAGLVGKTAQAKKEAQIARGLGYHAGMLSLGAMKGAAVDELIEHCKAVAAEIPMVGFYLQPAVGGIPLPEPFWRRFAAIEQVIAIKIAPFDRYRTLDVVRGVVAARAEERIALYTGNDDHILLDLAVPFSVKRNGEEVRVRIVGGLLGHWGVWTRTAVELIETSPEAWKESRSSMLALDSRITDCNSAFFDVANNFAGCIPGCHEVLRRQGLLEGTWCLDPNERLSPGQAEEIDRVYREHADLADDAFVRANLERWLVMKKGKNAATNGRDPERTRGSILASATAEFARYGLGGARVDRIAARAGANKRMLYYYFGDKDGLFLAALEERYAHIRNAERSLKLEHLDPRQAVRRLVEFTWRYFLEHPEFMTLLNSENLHKGRHVRRSRRVPEMHSHLVALLRDVLRRGERQGLFRKGVDPVQLYISIAGEGYFYLSNRYTLSRIFERDLMAPRALSGRARHISDMIVNALRR